MTVGHMDLLSEKSTSYVCCKCGSWPYPKEGFSRACSESGDYLKKIGKEILKSFPSLIEEVRGKGLMLGIKPKINNEIIIEQMRKEKILTVKASDNIIRLLPPLILKIPRWWSNWKIKKHYQKYKLLTKWNIF